MCCLEHIGLVYNRFTFDEHGLKLEDVKRQDRQNWASAQRICQEKTRECLRKLRLTSDVHQERTLGTEIYLQICGDYIDMFLSVRLDLQSRVVLAAKVSFFFRLWKLWIKHGDHGVLGNSKSVNAQESFVSQQCFVDIQMSCHFVVLLISLFREKYPTFLVPLHLTGSESCEMFFSKIGGMVGMERAYDFHELVRCANTLNQLAKVEYGSDGLKFARVHNKQANVWADLHPLAVEEFPANLGDYSLVSTDESIVEALKEGLQEAQRLLRSLNMAPSTYARNKKWFLEPWSVEKVDTKHFTYIPTKTPTAGEDGDCEVLRQTLEEEQRAAQEEEDLGDATLDNEVEGLSATVEDEEPMEAVAAMECEARDALSSLLDDLETHA
jgi:hypothetical protein